ncbi:C40 family peptidase [Pseudonocardia xinjiangensis]|jgi:cell wall-associated NlpC family hydrolase|uniref:C40 family peptidase n=1 Tax=Pseudonocardia xinjiangensis TaxID=75289 RepID=A0ABX1RQE3_9PSEU|nr:C40 family peptidase [Pseudonocardia xinjiangensis]NMH82608.1 C40 family peptidase [Pseudonocardia xinjiangensis]
MNVLRPLRLLVPFVAIAAALGLFLGIGFIAFSTGGGGGQSASYGPCDAGLDSSPLASGRAPLRAADLSDDQRRNAATIIQVARNLGAPPRAWLVALATAMQESTLRNINYGDRDSLGLFQQRPSQGWGSPSQVTDPTYSTTIFIQRLLAVPGWADMPVTVAAQTVQRSAFPDAYAKWEGLAADLVKQLADVSDPAGCGQTSVLPEGAAGAAIAFALKEVGKPYVWGATGPNTYDCSGLMLRAFQAAGINLPRVSRQQFYAGGHVPVAQAQPGDLLFYATDPSDPATIHHVVLYMGNGQMVEAPYTGQSVRVRPVPWDYAELVPLATRPGTTPNRA